MRRLFVCGTARDATVIAAGPAGDSATSAGTLDDTRVPPEGMESSTDRIRDTVSGFSAVLCCITIGCPGIHKRAAEQDGRLRGFAPGPLPCPRCILAGKGTVPHQTTDHMW